jgi:hypothetical protein
LNHLFLNKKKDRSKFEMEVIQNTLACTYCLKTLQSPISLPCGETICKHHVNAEENVFFCGTCYKNHEIPKEGFASNKIAEKMLETKINSLHFGEEYQKAVDAVKNIEELIKSCSLLQQDPEFEIDKVIGEIKSDIDLKREQLKTEIDMEAEKLIQRVIKYQNMCKEKAKKLDFKQMNETVKSLEEEVEKSQKDLNLLQIDKEKWMNIKTSLETHFENLANHYLNIRSELFLNILGVQKDILQLNFMRVADKLRFSV